jgi:hypothetical protein
MPEYVPYFRQAPKQEGGPTKSREKCPLAAFFVCSLESRAMHTEHIDLQAAEDDEAICQRLQDAWQRMLLKGLLAKENVADALTDEQITALLKRDEARHE